MSVGHADEEKQPVNRQVTKNVVIGGPAIRHEEAANVPLGSPARRGRKDVRHYQHHFSPRDRRRKLHGVRQLRRCENLNFLLSQAEKDEDESGEVDFVDLVSDHNSAFQELFLEQEKMSAWITFIDSSEEEQQKILSSVKCVDHSYHLLIVLFMASDKLIKLIISHYNVHYDNVTHTKILPAYAAANLKQYCRFYSQLLKFVIECTSQRMNKNYIGKTEQNFRPCSQFIKYLLVFFALSINIYFTSWLHCC